MTLHRFFKMAERWKFTSGFGFSDSTRLAMSKIFIIIIIITITFLLRFFQFLSRFCVLMFLYFSNKFASEDDSDSETDAD